MFLVTKIIARIVVNSLTTLPSAVDLIGFAVNSVSNMLVEFSEQNYSGIGVIYCDVPSKRKVRQHLEIVDSSYFSKLQAGAENIAELPNQAWMIRDAGR